VKPGNNSTEELISEFQNKLDRITIKIEKSKEDPKVVAKLRDQYKAMKKELYKLYMKLED
jgi:hypothetical protein